MTKGKFKGMKTISNRSGIITALAMDQRKPLLQLLADVKRCKPENVPDALMSGFKQCVTKELSPYASAVLLDPEYGLKAVKDAKRGTGVLMSYEVSGPDPDKPGRLPLFIPGWTVRQAVESGAHAIKFLLHYCPTEDRQINAIKHAIIERVGQECRACDVPLLLELIGYDAGEGAKPGSLDWAKMKPNVICGGMREFSKDRYAVDVLKVEIPVDLRYTAGTTSFAQAGRAYTRQQAMRHYQRCSDATTKPFVYLSAGVSDAQFRESLDMAVEAGVAFSGVLCGRATWQDGVPKFVKKGPNALNTWLQGRGVQNIKALNRVLAGATPWYERYGGLQRIRVK